MKKIFYLVLLSIITSCSKSNVDYVTIKGKFPASGIDKLTIIGNQGFTKDVTIDSNGSFLDTLRVKEGIHALTNGNDRITLFLKNGYDLTVNFKGNTLSDGAKFDGEGAETNNYIENKRLFFMSDLANPKTYFVLSKEDFEKRISEAKGILQENIDKSPSLDSVVYNMDSKNDKRFFDYLESSYQESHDKMVRFSKGKVSPEFNNYENFKGGKTSLKDLKGKYVYIDIWATWCGPCKREIPSLKNLEKDYHGKNIAFVSISVDNIDGKRGSHESWKKMVANEQLGGIQLFADNDFRSDFIREYGINSIPRFILLDPEGNIVDADADRPSNPKLIDLFTELGI
ncbi:TlpA family protein disulfide reductase [Lutibacter citreus]|uniref:TlpA family protein disulfide reductase n=1 Tax=Lutibacter citreus TaxID=2138210 RepID=UPI000DBEA349|nr:TlpA disulfide reductase family protein [Lutibacter citreus]